MLLSNTVCNTRGPELSGSPLRRRSIIERNNILGSRTKIDILALYICPKDRRYLFYVNLQQIKYKKIVFSLCYSSQWPRPDTVTLTRCSIGRHHISGHALIESLSLDVALDDIT